MIRRLDHADWLSLRSLQLPLSQQQRQVKLSPRTVSNFFRLQDYMHYRVTLRPRLAQQLTPNAANSKRMAAKPLVAVIDLMKLSQFCRIVSIIDPIE